MEVLFCFLEFRFASGKMKIKALQSSVPDANHATQENFHYYCQL